MKLIDLNIRLSVVNEDTDFARFRGLRWHNPLC
jgi:hypothetical protein